MTIKNIIGLAAPHTWIASITPVLLGGVLSYALTETFPIIIFLMVLIASILLQASVNTINDYYDFIRGTDKKENSDDPSDAVLIYNNISPKSVIRLGAIFMIIALLFGIYPVINGGIPVMIIGIIGCIVIVAYSAGKKPISFLPLGEFVSGFVMGGLITVATVTALSAHFSFLPLLLSIPLIIGIGLIMMTNNICDIERDLATDRFTLPVKLGRKRAIKLYLFFVCVWILSIIVLIAIFFRLGSIVTIIMLIVSIPAIKGLFNAPFTPDLRGPSMGAILKANIMLHVTFLLGIISDVIINMIFN